MARGGRRRRLSAEEGRRALLDAGRELARERPGSWPLDHVRLTVVAHRAGVSVGALYHYWESQDDYREDLLDDLFSPERYPPSPVLEMADAVEELPLAELVRLGAQVENANLRDNPELRLLFAMWATADPDVNDKIADQYRAVGERWRAFYQAALARYGLEIRPPFTYATMAAVITALGEGLAVRGSVDPGAVPDDLEQPTDAGEPVAWNLLGAAILALLPAISRPIGSDETLFDLLDGLQGAGVPVGDDG
jgi:AcrR family transcriptional regulator